MLPAALTAVLPELSLAEIRRILTTETRPYVTLKAATTLDGRIAMPSGESRWISGSRSRELGHELRACHDGVLVGIGTVLADNPALTVRLPSRAGGASPAKGVTRDGGDTPNPARVVLDSRCRIPPDAAVLAEDGAARFLVVGSQAPAATLSTLTARGVRVFQSTTPRPQPTAFLPWLREQGLELLLVEGGAEVHASFIAYSVADTLFLFIAGRVIGHSQAPAWCGQLGLSQLSQTPRLRLSPPRLVGDDLLLCGRFTEPDEARERIG